MQINDISERQITVTLSPEDAQRLARACKAAARIAGGDHGVTPESIFGSDYLPIAEKIYEVLAAAFEGAGMASLAHSYVSGEPPEFNLANLRAQKIGDRLW